MTITGPFARDAARAQGATDTLPPVTVTAPERIARRAAPTASPRTPQRPRRTRIVAAPTSRFVAADGVPAAGRGSVSSAVTALPAATSVIESGAIARAPVATYGDLFRAQPGFVVSDFGQGGIGYGLALRGFTEAEHGRDIAYIVDGVPINVVSSLHTPNYADLNTVLPESIARIEIVRGPFSVEAGDSNLGGSVFIATKDSEPFAGVSASGGTQGTARAVGTSSTTASAWRPYLAVEGYRTDGYRDNSWIDRVNAFGKVSTTLPDLATFSVSAQAFATQFGAPSYLPRDAIMTGAVSERAAVNRTDGGDRTMESVVANYSLGAGDHELKATLYASHDVFNRYADFGGGQRWQHDDRVTAGGRISRVFSGAVADTMPVQLLLGGSWRSDAIDAFQAPTSARQVSGAPVIDLGLMQHNLSAFAQAQIKPLPWLKLTAGGRFDQFYYDADDRLAPNAALNIAPSVTSPKFGVAVTPLAWLELFGNYGEGFRSPDLPLEVRVNPAIQPFKIVSREAGAQLSFDRVKLLGSVWTTESQNESFQAAPGLPVTFLGRARRDGFDLDGRFIVAREAGDSVTLLANYSGVRARLVDAAPSFYVPNVPSYVATLGVETVSTLRNAARLSATAYINFIGKKNLTQDGLLTTSPYRRVAAKLSYAAPEGWTAFTQATWYPGDRLSEIAINFGDPVGAASSDIVVSAQPALVVQAGLSWRFATDVAALTPEVRK